MNFDLDDPLGDLLSDDSNDSFFDGASNKKKLTSTDAKKRASSSPTPTTTTFTNKKITTDTNKSTIEDLFGIKNNTNITSGPSSLAQSEQQPQSLGIKKSSAIDSTLQKSKDISTSSIQKTEPIARSTPKKQISFNDDDDILSDLGFDPKKPKSGSGKKINILDDLLGVTETTLKIKPKTPPSQQQPQPINRQKTAPTTSGITSAQLSRQSTLEKTDPDDVGYAPSTTNRPRTAAATITDRRKSSSNLSDPLAFLSSEENTMISKNTPETKRKLQKKPIVDWLGLGDDVQIASLQPSASMQPQQQSTKIQQIESNTNLTTSQPSTTQAAVQEIPETLPHLNPNQSIANLFKTADINQGTQLLTNANIESTTMLENLKQQEIQLVMANQMKNQEIALIDMQKNQRELLQKQESRFNDLLQKQLMRQGILEENIRRQQERINSHIQMLMAQPNHFLHQPIDSDKNEFVEITDNDDNVKIEHGNPKLNHILNIQLTSDVKRLELEKLRLEDLLQNIKTNHDQEIDLLEQSYRKQLTYLEQMLEKIQIRLTDENLAQEEFYKKKIITLEQVKENLIKDYESKMNELQRQYEETILKLKRIHTDEIDELKSGHKLMIENIRQTKLMEFAVLQENTSYLQTLKNAVNYLESSGDELKTIQVDMNDKIERLHSDREEQLRKRERRVETEQIQLDKIKESQEDEKSNLLELVKTLEIKLNAVTQSSAEEQWTLRQQRASFEAERKSFEREKEFVREQCLREEQKLNEMKAYQLSEYERRMKQLDAEHLEILSEKSKLETLNRLQKSSEVQISKTEIDSAVKVAEEAARQSDVERERLLGMQRHCETKKRELINQESALRSKENELEIALNTTNSKEREAENAIKLTKIMENKLITRIKLLQQNYRELYQRESRLSQEKLEISKERLEIQDIRKKIFQSRCSLCKIGESNQEFTDLLLKNNVDPVGATTSTTFIGNIDEQLPIKQKQQQQHIEMFKIVDNVDNPIQYVNCSLNNKFDIVDNIFNGYTNTISDKYQNNNNNNFDNNLEMIPNITETSDNLLNPDLLLLKFDLLDSQKNF